MSQGREHERSVAVLASATVSCAGSRQFHLVGRRLDRYTVGDIAADIDRLATLHPRSPAWPPFKPPVPLASNATVAPRAAKARAAARPTPAVGAVTNDHLP